MAKSNGKNKRANRTMDLSEAVGAAIGPVFRKRGFASRDIVSNWAAIAPAPYDRTAVPDRLAWRRGEAGAEGATLYLRCAEGQRLALAHEGPAITAAVNRYFGYVLVGKIKLSPTPFIPGSDEKPQEPVVSARVRQEVESALTGIEDDGLKQALRRLGVGLLSRNR